MQVVTWNTTETFTIRVVGDSWEGMSEEQRLEPSLLVRRSTAAVGR